MNGAANGPLRDTDIRVGEALSTRWEKVSLDGGDEQVRVL